MNKVLSFVLGIWVLTSCSSSSDQSTEMAVNRTVADSVYRPAYHFSPYKNYAGSPISMIFHNNEYHLFYQYNTEDADAESNSWGHAVSSDMMKWEEISFIPDFSDYDQGAIVSDMNNLSGLGQNLLIAITSDDDKVNLSYSTNGGTNWSEYSENPVLEFSGSPKVSWNDATNQWIMTMTEETQVTFFSSDDMIRWSQESELELEKPVSNASLFFLPEAAGLLLSSDTGVDVLIGGFDGSAFTPSSDPIPFDLGPDNSAGTVFSSGGRSVYIGLMNNSLYSEDLPTKSWQSSFTLPRELSIANDVVSSFPVSEINSMLTAKRRGKLDLLKGNSANWYSFKTIEASKNIEIAILNDENEKLVLGYDQSSFTLDRSASGLTDFHSSFEELMTTQYDNLGDTLKFDIFIDRSSVEIFINDGQLQFSSLVFPQNPYTSVELMVGDEKNNIPATIYDVDKVMF